MGKYNNKQYREYVSKKKKQGLKNVNEFLELRKKRVSNRSIDLSIFNISAVYFLCRDNEIVYVGETRCLLTRISQHINEGVKKFDSFFFEEVEESKRKKQEAFYIKKHSPILNFTHNPLMGNNKQPKFV